MKAIKLRVLLLCAFLLSMPAITSCASASDGMLKDQIAIEKADGETLYFTTELALTPSEQAHGLMDRTILDENSSMLFVFGTEQPRSFWMKNTLIPLDMLFIAKDGTIHHIHHMAKPQDKSLITSKRPAMAVLEINGGLSDKLGIKEGDRIIHSLFRNKLAP